MSLFKKEKKALKKVDTLITWLVLGWILASVYWIKKYEDSKRAEHWNPRIESEKKEEKKCFLKKFFWKKKIEEKKDSLLMIIIKIVIKKLIWKK